MTPPSHAVSLAGVADALEALGVTYHIGGSVASSQHGKGRSTLDVDVIADLRAEHVSGLVAGLRDAYYVDEDAVRQAVQTHGAFNAIHLGTMLKVDVFVAGEAPFDREEMRRAVRRPLTDTGLEREFPVKSPEDIVLRKLSWYRSGGEVSTTQWQDVLNVIRVQDADFDVAYARRWAVELGVADLFEEALTEAADYG